MKAPTTSTPVDARPLIAGGIAVKKSECIAMGPTLRFYGCIAIARGDVTRKPHCAECRERVIEWLKMQDDLDIQERLAAAQKRTETSKTEEDKEEDWKCLGISRRRRRSSTQSSENQDVPPLWDWVFNVATS